MNKNVIFLLVLIFTSCSNEVSQTWIYPFQKDQIKYWRGYNQEVCFDLNVLILDRNNIVFARHIPKLFEKNNKLK